MLVGQFNEGAHDRLRNTLSPTFVHNLNRVKDRGNLPQSYALGSRQADSLYRRYRLTTGRPQFGDQFTKIDQEWM